MKISRESSVFLVFTLIVAIITGQPEAWFKLIFYTIGLVTLIVTILSVLKYLITPKGKVAKDIAQIKDTVAGAQTITLKDSRDQLPLKNIRNIQTIHEGSATDLIHRDRMFSKNINALDANGRMPNSLVYPVAMKTLYELNKKHGSLRFEKSVPIISQEEILRPLNNDEVNDFQAFCREQMIDLSLSYGKL